MYSSLCHYNGSERVFLRAQDPASPLLTFNLCKGRVLCHCRDLESRCGWQFSANFDMTSHTVWCYIVCNAKQIVHLQDCWQVGPREFTIVDATTGSTVTLLVDTLNNLSSFVWGVHNAKFDILPMHRHSPIPLPIKHPIRRPILSTGEEHIRAANSLDLRLTANDGNVGSSTPVSARSAPSITSVEESFPHVSSAEQSEHLLSGVIGNIAELAKNQWGSRFLQDTIRECDGRNIRFAHNCDLIPGDSFDRIFTSLIFSEVLTELPSLVVDRYGTYLCQTLICKCSDVQREQILSRLSTHIVEISCNRQGTRVVQKIIQLATTSEQVFFASCCSRFSLITLCSASVIFLLRHCVPMLFI